MRDDPRRNLKWLEQQLQERQALETRQQQLQSQTESAQLELEALRRHHAVCSYRDAQLLREQTQIAIQTSMDA